MMTEDGGLVLDRGPGELMVIRRGREKLVIEVDAKTSIRVIAPQSFRILRGEIDGPQELEPGLALTRKPGETVVIYHGCAKLEFAVSSLVGIHLAGPRSFRILRGELDPNPDVTTG